FNIFHRGGTGLEALGVLFPADHRGAAWRQHDDVVGPERFQLWHIERQRSLNVLLVQLLDRFFVVRKLLLLLRVLALLMSRMRRLLRSGRYRECYKSEYQSKS